MKRIAFLAAALVLAATGASAQVKIGVTIPLTGPVAMLGLGQKNVMEIYPDRIGDTKVEYIVIDDASDTTTSVINTKKLISEHKVDAIIGSSTSPQSLAMIDTVAEAQLPMVSLGSSNRIVEPMDAKKKWVFKVPPNDAVWIEGMVRHMVANNQRSIGFIGFNDAFGESWAQAMNEMAPKHNLRIVASERYNRNDPSVTAQALKLMAARPDAIVIAASGTPAALPATTLRERGYKGAIYFNASVATKEFLQVAGPGAEGALLTVGAGLVLDGVPDSNPLKKVNQAFVQRYEARFGKGATNIFAMQGYDAFRILEKAVPVALAKAQPGTREFRVALRDAIEGVRELHGNTGIYSFSPTDHSGLDLRAVVMARIEKGRFVYVPQPQ